ETGFITGHTVSYGCFPAFVFFLQPLRPFASEPSLTFSPPYTGSFLAHQEMASLVHPRRFQTEGELNTVRRLLGWSAQETGWGVRAGSVPLGNLRAGEFVLFTSHISTSVGLPISSFLLLLLEDFGLQLQHLTPYSLLLTSIFVHLCGMFVGGQPCVFFFPYFFLLVRSGRGRYEVGGGGY